MKQMVIESWLDTVIANAYRNCREIVLQNSMGFMTSDECNRHIVREIEKIFIDELSRYVHYHINKITWNSFFKDYQCWTLGLQLEESSDELPWLSYGPRYADAASTADRAMFFRLMDAFCIPVAHFEPAPIGTICPDTHYTLPNGDGSENVTIDSGRFGLRKYEKLTSPQEIYDMKSNYPGYLTRLESTGLSDGGLLQDDAPVGKTFAIDIRYGLKASMTIKQTNVKADENRYAYMGMGTIEGYTSNRERKIYISVVDNEIFSFDTVQSKDDAEAMDKFPLWREYREYMEKQNMICEKIVNNLYMKFRADIETNNQ